MGSLFLVIVIVILTACSLLNKQLVGKINPFTIQWIQAGLNTLMLPVWYFLSRKFATTDQLTLGVGVTAVLTGLLSSIGFVFFLAALREKPVFIATAYLSTYPAITMVLCSLWGAEKLTVARVIGVLAILGGIFLIQVFDKV